MKFSWFAMLGLIITNCLTGCTTITVTGSDGESISRTPTEFRAYAERVFRLQNSALDELIEALELAPAESAAADESVLRNAEARLVAACRNLNEAASLSAGGGTPGLALRLRVLDSIVSCEQAALAVRGALGNSEPVIVSAGR